MSAWTNGIYTKKGLALLAKLTQGSSLNITRAVTGTGYVTPSTAANQTTVTGIKQTLSFKAASYPETGVCKLPMYLTNKGVTAGYKARQLGIYALDPDDGEILYFISQSEAGTDVPSEEEMPEYSAAWTFYFRYGQATDVSVTVDPSHTITEDMLNEVRVIAETGVSAPNIGHALTIKNTAELPFANLRFFGNTTQDGTPTPDNPVELVPAADRDGAPALGQPYVYGMTVNVYGKNLCPMSAFDTMSSNGENNTYDASTHTITFNADATSQNGRYYPPLKNMVIGKPYTISFDIKGTNGKIVYCGWGDKNRKITLTTNYVRYSCTLIADKASEQVIFYTEKTASGGLASGEYMQFANVQIELAEAATDFEEYKELQKWEWSNGPMMNGIPVKSGGNYTDANGQQWICDEIDLARGVLVRRCVTKTFDGSESDWRQYGNVPTFMTNWSGASGGWVDNKALSTHMICHAGNAYSGKEGYFGIDEKGLCYFANGSTTLEDFKSWIAANNVTVVCALATPVEEEIDYSNSNYIVTGDFDDLHSNNPVTTIVTNCSVNLEADCFLAQHEAGFKRIFNYVQKMLAQ